MSQFNDALEYLHNSLLQLREQGKENLTASKQSLEDLLSAEAADGQKSEVGGQRSEAGKDEKVKKADQISEIRGQKREIVESHGPLTSDIRPLTSGLASSGKAARMDALRAIALSCQKCAHLAATRTQVVFGVGDLDAEIMFVGEAPGADEDLQGEPFVGKAGQLLTKIITAMGLSREEVYIGNVLKCRPDMPPGDSGNRKPRADEMATCLPYLKEQIQIIQPKALVALGATAMQGLIGATEPMNQLRGRWHQFEGIPLMATYHPAYLLRNQAISEKRKVWEDMLLVLERLGKPISEKQRNFFK